MTFHEQFKEDYKEWFKTMNAAQLIRYEENLSAFIDSDFYENSILADEVEILYELIRDECVNRVAKIAEQPI